MLLKSILTALEQIAPLQHAEPWDNVGLLTGDPDQSINRIMITIDYTKAVAEEARSLDSDLIIAYHPPLFSAVKRITATGSTAMIYDAIRRGVAIYSPHTAWDAAGGGTNDFLADSLGLVEVTPLRLNASAANYLKLVTFVPEKNIDAVSTALFNAGAGQIGNYSCCSFRAAGIGTFFGEPGTHPTVGEVGKLEKQQEIRLETVIPTAKASEVVHALVAAHPYEEPAYDLTVLSAVPTGTGQGRVGNLSSPAPLEEVVDRLKLELNLAAVLVSPSANKTVTRVGICAGAGDDLLDATIAAKADLFLTGELRHHHALQAAGSGMNVICTLHSNCERPSLTRLKTRLEQLLGDSPQVFLSQTDRDPFSIR